MRCGCAQQAANGVTASDSTTRAPFGSRPIVATAVPLPQACRGRSRWWAEIWNRTGLQDSDSLDRASALHDCGAGSSSSRTVAQISRYMAEAQLPDRMQPGRYRVEISRDATSWVSVPSDDQGVAQYFTVSDDPPEAERYPVDDPKFGGCRADDGRDATACIVRAIAAARAHGGGSVVFGPGKWSMNDSSVPGVRPYDGILVPEKVDLIGAGPGLSILQRGTTWGSDPFGNPTQLAAFSLLGNNRIEGITFRDQRVYSSPRHYPYMAMLQIGTNTSPVSNVSITHNVFDRPTSRSISRVRTVIM